MEFRYEGPEEYCSALVSEVEELTGYPFVLAERKVQEFDSDIRFATPGSPRHVLTYLARYRDHLDHFVASSAFKILRVWRAEEEDRYLAASEIGRGLSERDFAELRRKLPARFPRDKALGLSRFIFSGLLRQLTSYPTDLRVEAEIAESLPEHSEKQGAYLRIQVRDFLPTLSEEILSVIPEKPYLASTAMNIAFAEIVADLSGTSPDPLFRRHRSRSVAERLLDHYSAVEKPGLPGDRSLTDAWANELDLADWYEWRRFGNSRLERGT